MAPTSVVPGPYPVVHPPQGCYEKVKLWFDDNKHVLGTVGMCILIMQVRGPRAPRLWVDASQSHRQAAGLRVRPQAMGKGGAQC